MPMWFKKAFLITLSLCCYAALSVQAQPGTGCVLDAEKYEQVPLAHPLMRGDFRDLPFEVSLRKYAPTPQNQGSYGNCVGWSTAYAARTILMAKQQGWDNLVLVTQNAFSPFFVYEQAKAVTDIYCQDGTSLYNALEIIKQVGTVKLQDYDEQCGQIISNNLQKAAQEFRIKDYKRLFESRANNKVTLVKKSLAEGKPVIIGIQCCAESFLGAHGLNDWQLQATDDPDPEGGHALTVVAYDDHRNGGSFELMNSWGTSWGNQGFIWVTYDDFERYCFEAYEMSSERVGATALAGSVRFQLQAGEEMPAFYKDGYYEMRKSYSSGTLFQVLISNQQPAFVYAFVSDDQRQNTQIFPLSDKYSAYLGYKANHVAIPDEDHYLQLDDNTGTDYFCILYSAEKLDIKKIMQEVSIAPGSTFMSRLNYVLGDKMLTTSEVNYKIENGISFDGLSYDLSKGIVPIVVSLSHY